MTGRGRGQLLALCAALLGVVSLSACGGDNDNDVELTSVVSPPPPLRIVEDWEACGELDCTTLTVPLDYDEPGAGSLDLALARRRALPAQGYRGTIVLNNGGPGASAVSFLGRIPEQVAANLFPGYDIVAFDPRGVGGSQGFGCDLDFDRGSVYFEGGAEALRANFAERAEQCEVAAGPVIRHMHSTSVVQDMDAIRIALGEPKLTFLGMSYGTQLAAQYAQTYPETTRAVVLDAPVRPHADLVGAIRIRLDQFLELQDNFFAACDDESIECPENPREVLRELELAAAAQGDLRPWSTALQILVRAAAMPAYEVLAEALRIFSTDREEILGSFDELREELEAVFPDDDSDSLSFAANITVRCLDDSQGPINDEELADLWEASPSFFQLAGQVAACSEGPGDPKPVEIGAITGYPALLIGGRTDENTPLDLAYPMRNALGKAVLIVGDHDGHAALQNGGCGLSYISRYLTELELPQGDVECE